MKIPISLEKSQLVLMAVIIVLALFAQWQSWQQEDSPCYIRGEVIEKLGFPVDGALILVNDKIVTETNSFGEFSLTIANGQKTGLSVKKEGFVVISKAELSAEDSCIVIFYVDFK